MKMEYKRLTETKDERYWENDVLWTSAREPDIEEIDAIYARLSELEDKVENKTLIELPCKVGDTVYIFNTRKNGINIGIVRYFRYEQYYPVSRLMIGIQNMDSRASYSCHNYSSLQINKTWFLTREQSEAALKELKGEKHKKYYIKVGAQKIKGVGKLE